MFFSKQLSFLRNVGHITAVSRIRRVLKQMPVGHISGIDILSNLSAEYWKRSIGMFPRR